MIPRLFGWTEYWGAERRLASEKLLLKLRCLGTDSHSRERLEFAGNFLAADTSIKRPGVPKEKIIFRRVPMKPMFHRRNAVLLLSAAATTWLTALAAKAPA